MEGALIKVTSMPFLNRMAKKCPIELAKNSLPDTVEKKAEIMAAISESPWTRKVQEKFRLKVIALKALTISSKALKLSKMTSQTKEELHLEQQNHFLLVKMLKKVEARRYFQGSSPWIEEASSKELRNVKLFWKVKSHTGLQPNKNQAG